jgi:hypothetical protein
MNEGLSRTLITDYQVKGDWLIPDFSKILGAEKYVELDKDITQALNASIFDSGEKFANASVKIQIFIERLKEARNAYLNNFLQNEIIRVCQSINAKNYPTAEFEELNFRDELQYAKVAVQMAQLGLLTAEECFEAIDTGKYPELEVSLKNQQEYKVHRDDGLYQPLIGGSTTIQSKQLDIQSKQADNQMKIAQMGVSKPGMANAPKPKQSVGRPSGSAGPRAATVPKPIGSKAALEGFGISLIEENTRGASELQNAVESELKKKFGLETLDQTQVSVAKTIVSSIISNEDRANWTSSAIKYTKKPKEISEAAQREIDDIQIAYNVDGYLAAILRLSRITVEEENEQE